MSSAPAALLFDMDGLLLDTEQVCLLGLLDVASPIGIARAEAERFYLTLVGVSSAESRRRVVEFLPAGHDHLAFGAAWDKAIALRLAEQVPVKPHVAAVLDSLADARHRMAVVTSTRGEAARHHLQRAGIHHHFERITGGDEVSANKPDPAPYVEMAKALGVRPEDCIAFEDSDHGLRAAVAAGCHAVQIPDLRPLDIPLPDLGQKVASDLRHAMQLVGLLP